MAEVSTDMGTDEVAATLLLEEEDDEEEEEDEELLLLTVLLSLVGLSLESESTDVGMCCLGGLFRLFESLMAEKQPYRRELIETLGPLQDFRR